LLAPQRSGCYWHPDYAVPNPFFGLNSIYPKTIAVSDLLRPYPEFGNITDTQARSYS
jgi:hypothetical protein